MSWFIKGDIVTASPEAIEAGLWIKKPSGRKGVVARVAEARKRDGARCVAVRWDGNRSDGGLIHPDFLILVERPEKEPKP